jgi:twitching motility protein PilT
LLQKDLITFEEALRRASNPDEFKLKSAGIQSASEMAQEAMESTLQDDSCTSDPQQADSPFEFTNKG